MERVIAYVGCDHNGACALVIFLYLCLNALAGDGGRAVHLAIPSRPLPSPEMTTFAYYTIFFIFFLLYTWESFFLYFLSLVY
jgi:hypothetical protein